MVAVILYVLHSLSERIDTEIQNLSFWVYFLTAFIDFIIDLCNYYMRLLFYSVYTFTRLKD